jgi:hypothetical protein
MTRAKRKSVTVTVTVTVPNWLTVANTRKEVRALLQGFTGHQRNYSTEWLYRTLGQVGDQDGLIVRKVA